MDREDTHGRSQNFKNEEAPSDRGTSIEALKAPSRVSSAKGASIKRRTRENIGAKWGGEGRGIPLPAD